MKEDLEKLAQGLKSTIKKAHKEMMSNLSEEEREKVNIELNKKINSAKKESNSPFMDSFIKDIYGV